MTAKAEPSLASAKAGDRFQLERVGFFIVDQDSKPGAVVLNRTVALKDSWQKIAAKAGAPLGAPESKKDAKKERAAAVEASPREAAELSPAAVAIRDAHDLPPEIARVIGQEPVLLELFTGAVSAPRGEELAKQVATLLANDLLGELRARRLERVPFEGRAVSELAALIKDSTIGSAQTKEVLAEMLTLGKAPKAIVEGKGLAQIASEGALAPMVDQVLADNADAVGRYKAGNVNVLGALVGMVMKRSGGRANAKLVKELVARKLA